MFLDIKGKVNNIKLTKANALLPLFEAVVNSLQSIEELEHKEDAYINILINRDSTQPILEGVKEDGMYYPIESFIIEDNGVGLNSKNFLSFQTSDSTYKLLKGGKGVGRFLWLKAFENIKIESTYKERGNIFYRSLKFILADEPIEIIEEKKLKER